MSPVTKAVSRKVRGEHLAYYLILLLMAISMTGFSYLRYAIYTAPVFAFFIWLLSGNLRLRYNHDLTPFYLLLAVSLLTVAEYDFNSVKKLVFISVYIVVFTLFDFRRIRIDVAGLGIYFLFLFVIRLMFEGKLGSAFVFSLVDSRSSLENTMSFPFGLVAIYFLIQRRFLYSGVAAALALVSLKRIVLLGLSAATLIGSLPRRIRPFVVNPYVAVAVTLTVLFTAITFAQGFFDEFLMEFAGIPPNDLSKGRQVLWSTLLEGANYRFDNFVLFGLGNGSSVTILQELQGGQRILVHNDVLATYIEFGLIVLVLFIFLLNKHKAMPKRIMAMYMTILFVTDNVLIYQHVMMTYLLLMSQLERCEPDGKSRP